MKLKNRLVELQKAADFIKKTIKPYGYTPISLTEISAAAGYHNQNYLRCLVENGYLHERPWSDNKRCKEYKAVDAIKLNELNGFRLSVFLIKTEKVRNANPARKRRVRTGSATPKEQGNFIVVRLSTDKPTFSTALKARHYLGRNGQPGEQYAVVSIVKTVNLTQK